MGKESENDTWHTMKVSPRIWRKAQKLWGLENPASELREVLNEYFDDLNGKPTTDTVSKIKDAAVKGAKEVLKSWSSDKQVALDFEEARAAFLKHRIHFWDDTTMTKDGDEIDDFLESLEDYQDYEDLTDKQQGLFGVIRRAHHQWVRKG